MRTMQREMPVGFDEKVDPAGDNDLDEVEEEVVDYGEVEEEMVDYGEVEEEAVDYGEVEEIEEMEEEDVVEEEDKHAHKCTSADEPNVEDVREKKKHADLLALPPHGSEVYIGGIPCDVLEKEIRGFCGPVGEVTEVRVIKEKNSSGNKRFAFVTFRNVELASKAVKELDNTEFKGRKVKCSISQSKHQLYIGNVPIKWENEDLKKVVTKIGPGVVSVKLVKDKKNQSNNCTSAFIDYYNHACAEYSRKEMMNRKLKLDEKTPTVSWADSKNESSFSSHVKAVYVKNLPISITEDQLEKLFAPHGEITKVVLPPTKSGQEKNRFGYVHFLDRSSAMKALKNTEKYEIDGSVLQCCLAKPPANQRSVGTSDSQKPGLLSRYPARNSYGLLGAGGAYGVLGAGYRAPGFTQQALIQLRGPAPVGMSMMPLHLPNGRMGYILQQPQPQPHLRSRPQAQPQSQSRSRPQSQARPQPHSQPRSCIDRPYHQRSSIRSSSISSRGRQSGDSYGRRYCPY